MADRLETLARELEASPDFRVLRRLVPRETFDRSDADPPLIGIVLDCETTGLDPTLDEIIELAMLRFSFTPDGSILRILASFDELEQPRLPIPPEITTLTGITNDMVEGRTIDANDVEAFVADAAIVVAHNARFDRAFAENAFVVFREMEWACSVDQIPWREHGYEGTKLPYLLAHHGFFTNAHRAGDDCRALLHVLASPFIPQGKSAFSVLLRNAKEETIRIHAVGAPYVAKDTVKKRRYRWSDGSDGSWRAWWRDVSPEEYDREMEFLRANVFDGRVICLPTSNITARERYSLRAAQ